MESQEECGIVAERAAPTATIELLLIVALLEAFRLANGVDACREDFVGPMRASLGRAFPANVLEINAGQTPELVSYMEAQRSAADLLGQLCRACGGCELAR